MLRTAGALLFVGLLTTEIATAGQEADDSRSLQAAQGEPGLTEQWVRIATPAGRTLRTLIVGPGAAAPAHAVLLVHENRGLTDWECQFASELAARGYLVIAPDLLSQRGPGHGDSDAFESAAAARAVLGSLAGEQILDELNSVLDYAAGLSTIDGKIAAVGFGWGGGQVFRLATHKPQLAAAVVFDGLAPTDEQLQQLRVPVVGFYAEHDVRISGEVPKLKSRLRELNKDFRATTYSGAGHAFMRIGAAADAKPADRKARLDAWLRLEELLGQI